VGDRPGSQDSHGDHAGGRDDSEPGRELLGGREAADEAAGIGVPLVAMICHSADPLLIDVRGRTASREG
jgi:hypothetical protein